LADGGAEPYINYQHVCCLSEANFSEETMRDMIRAVGVAHVILSSDFGQKANGNPVRNYVHHLEQIKALGFSDQEIRQMTCTNPQKILTH
jgi:hypothetical protein